jgi:hypothetical protein
VSSLAHQQGAGQLLLAQRCARSTHPKMKCTQCITDGRVVHKVHGLYFEQLRGYVLRS